MGQLRLRGVRMLRQTPLDETDLTEPTWVEESLVKESITEDPLAQDSLQSESVTEADPEDKLLGEDSLAEESLAQESVAEDPLAVNSTETGETGTDSSLADSEVGEDVPLADSGEGQDNPSGGTSVNASPITPGTMATRLFNSGSESFQGSSAGEEETRDRPQALRSPVAPSRQGRPSPPQASSPATSETGTGTGGGLACGEGCEGTYEAPDSDTVERNPLIRARRNERGELEYELIESSGSDAADRAALETARQSRFEGDRDEFTIRARVAQNEEEAQQSRERVERQRERARQAAEPTPQPDSQETVVQEWDNPPSSTVNSDWEEEVTSDPLANPLVQENLPQLDATPTSEPLYEEPVYQEPLYEEPVYEEPVYQEPLYEEPVYEEPVYQEPLYEEPVYEEPMQKK